MVQEKLKYVENTKILAIRFENRNVIYGTFTHENRWIITVDTEMGKRELLRGFIRNGVPIVVRRYDDVVKEEYRMFMRYQRIYERHLDLVGFQTISTVLGKEEDTEQPDCVKGEDESVQGRH